MSKGVLVVAGLVVVAGIVALVLFLGGDSGDSAPSASATQGSAVAISTTPPPTGRGASAPTVTPALPGSERAGALPPSDSEHPREYVVGDVHVRDHRSGNNTPIDLPPNVHPAEGRTIPSALTHDVAQKVKEVMEQCVADLPKDARGTSPRLEGQIKIAIKDHKLTVTNAFMQLRDVVGAGLDTTKQCIEQKSVGLQSLADGQEDLEGYDIRLSFAIP